MKIYFDNAATTPILPEVREAIMGSMEQIIGNPSSTHQWGREANVAVEHARRSIASSLNIIPPEIYFTAGGSEADNLILYNAIAHWEMKHIITTTLEHSAVYKTILHLQKHFDFKLSYVKHFSDGGVDIDELEKLIAGSQEKTLVSLMFVNNETGRLLDIEKVSAIIKKHDAFFHSDTVQGIGKFPFDLQKLPIDFLAASAHKFHGPKGVGFMRVPKEFKVHPLLTGGSQERGSRAGTENVHSVVGMAKALELANKDLEKTKEYVQSLKKYAIIGLKANIPDIQFNAASDDERLSAYHILNIRLPKNIPMLIFNLDIKGIAVSGGSACQSGSTKPSRVLTNLLSDDELPKTSLRISFSKLNKKAEIDYFINSLLDLY